MTLTAIAQQLDRLTRLKPGKTPIISCYLKIEARDRARGKYLIKLKNRIRAAQEGLPALGFTKAEQDVIAKDLDRLLRELQQSASLPGTQGVAVFISSGLKLFERVELASVYRSRLVVDRSPQVRELLASEDEVGRLLTVVMDRTSARIYEVTAFGANEVADIRSEATRGGKFHSDRHGAPGIGEHGYHNRIRNEKQRHLGTIADTLFALDRKQPVHGIVVACIGSDAAALGPFLHPYLRERLIGAVKLNPKNPREMTPAHVHEATLEARAKHEAAEEEKLAAEVELGTGTGWAVNGVRDTLKALAAGQVRSLLVNPDAALPGFRCDSGRLTLSEKECRNEGGCVPVPDVIDDAVEEALRQRLPINVVHSAGAAARVDGLAGLLRFR
jgi:peptide subunit release factor 1 (eRF1)